MKFPTQVFREYDIRGISKIEINESFSYELGQAFGSLAMESKARNIIVGYDGRLSSPSLKRSLVEGLTSTGINVTDVGLGPTPMIYFANQYYQADGAIMVTGSHNPPEDNGFKMVLQGEPVFSERIQLLKNKLENRDFILGKGYYIKKNIQVEYVKHLLQDFHLHYGKNNGALKVIWDTSNGATGQIVSKLITDLPGEHIILNGEIDGRFPSHHPDPVVLENLKELREEVLKQKADIGIAFDGDGDRIGIVDDKAEVLWGDQLMILYSQEVLSIHPGSIIIADVKSSQTLYEQISKMGGKAYMWKTGHSLIKSKLKELQAPLAGEMSGHIFFGDRNFGYDDAIYAAIRTIGILSKYNEKLSDWRLQLPKIFNTPEIRINVNSKDKFEIISRIKNKINSKDISIIDIDGIRVNYTNGWWLLRASNTQEMLVARIEGKSPKDLIILQNDLQKFLSSEDISLSI